MLQESVRETQHNRIESMESEMEFFGLSNLYYTTQLSSASSISLTMEKYVVNPGLGVITTDDSWKHWIIFARHMRTKCVTYNFVVTPTSL